MLALLRCVVFSPLPCSFFLSYISKAHAEVGLLGSWRSVRGQLLIHLQLLTMPLLGSGLSCFLFWLSAESPHYLLPTTSSSCPTPALDGGFITARASWSTEEKDWSLNGLKSHGVPDHNSALLHLLPKGELVLTQIHPPSAVGPSSSGPTLTPTALMFPRGPLCALSLYHTCSA